jgi:hypothetical protein
MPSYRPIKPNVCGIALFVGALSLVSFVGLDGKLSGEEKASHNTTVTHQDLEELKRSGWQRSRFQESERLEPIKATTPVEKIQPRLVEFEQHIAPILKKSCLDCHGPEEQEGNIRIDTLDPNLHIGGDVDWWTDVFAVVSKGEMPPADSDSLTDEERKKIVDWLSGELQAASIARRESTTNTTFRRLTRYETNYALQDLLGLPWDFAKDLPPEANSEDGFQNSSSQLHLSVSQFETYHRLARTAISRAISIGPQPRPLFWGIPMTAPAKLSWSKQAKQVEQTKERLKDKPEELEAELKRLAEISTKAHRQSYYKEIATGKTTPVTWEYSGAKYANLPSDQPVPAPGAIEQVAILPAGQSLNIELGNQLPNEGILRVRVRAARAEPDGERIPSMQLHFGWQATNEGRALLRVSQEDTLIAAQPGDPAFYQWDVPLGEIYPRNSVRTTSPMGALPSPSEYIRFVNSSASPDPILIDFVEVQAPVYDEWPTASHKRLFPGSTTQSNRSIYTRELLTQFMTRAWRRPPTAAEIDQKMELLASFEIECEHFEEAVGEVYATILSSPHFLYAVQHDTAPHTSQEATSRQWLTAHQLATRLSLFLWCSLPDDELLRLADSNQLLEKEVLSMQVVRMLADPKSNRFSQHFVHQWLNMELLEFLNFKQHLPGFDPLLKEAMQWEPVEFFQEILKNNETVLNFLHSDYAMVNERLARHYGLPNVLGNDFRRVPVGETIRLGGLLTQAGLLAMNSDYPDSHPLKRGKWLLVSLLNDPPPPPPPAVPQIDLANPEIAKMTLKERIEDHRNHPACMSCHVKIDPWGIAFENYDALGKWRDEIRGQRVDAESDLFNRESLDGMAGLKRFLLENRQDQFVSALVYKVATYALGRPMKFSDRADLDRMTAEIRKRGDGLRTLLVTVATSDLFRSR